jgi:hypothetical protein
MTAARPAGVFWARTGLPAGSRMCEDGRHGVYRRRQWRQKRGAPDERARVEVWACVVCWPPTPQVQEQAAALEAAARRKRTWRGAHAGEGGLWDGGDGAAGGGAGGAGE